jgi:hypothetical protein
MEGVEGDMVSTDGDIAQDCRQDEREQAFQAYIEGLGREHMCAIIESQLDNSKLTKALYLAALGEAEDSELAEWIIEHCRTDSLRAEFENLPNPSRNVGVNPQNA